MQLYNSISYKPSYIELHPGGTTGPARRVQVNDPDRRRSFELGIAAAVPEDGRGRHLTLQAVGEAKASRLDTSDLTRLDRLAQLLAGRNRVSPSPTLKRLLFSLEGFTPALIGDAKRRSDVELVDLDRLYHGS